MIQFNNACVAGAFFTAVVVLLSGCKRSEFDGPEWKVQDPEMTVLFQKMSDAALTDLVRRGVGRDELVSIFGEPTLSLKQDDAEYLSFNFAITHVKLRDGSGRVGFTATLYEGKMVDWGAISH